MERFSLILANTEDQDPCDFTNHITPPLFLDSGEWWVGLSKIEIKYPFTGKRNTKENIYASLDITKPLLFANQYKKILTSINGELPRTEYFEEEIEYIKVEKGIYEFITVTLRNQRGLILKASPQAFHPTTYLTLNFKGVETVEINPESDTEDFFESD